MTNRERYLKALHNQKTDALVWAPNFDYWLSVNKVEGTLPDKYKGLSRNDIVRAIGGAIWNRTCGFKEIHDNSVKHTYHDEGTRRIHEVTTPLGALREVHTQAEGEHRSRACTEHFIKKMEDIQVMKYIVEATRYEPDYEPVRKALQETGDDGVVLSCGHSVPFIQFAKMDAGYLNAFFLWTDYRKEVDGLIAAYFKNYVEAFRILAEGPADVLHAGDNMDGIMISPPVFKEYAIPFYQEVRKFTQAKGKIFEGHWCGRTENLLPYTPGCGLDAVEAIVSKPMANITLAEALDRLKGEVVLQGGIPAVLVCNEGGTDEDFDRHMREVILPQKGRKGFILGMSDNVPPNADFARVERISKMIA